MLTLVARLKVNEAAVPRFREAIGPLVAATRAESGCHHYEFHQSNDEPGLFVVWEKWADQAALDRHFAAPHLAEWRAAWPALGIGDRDLMLYDAATFRAI